MDKVYKSIIRNLGFILAIIGLIVYIITLLIMVVGISNEERNLTETLIYSGASAVLGIFMSIALGIQGVKNAEDEYKDLRLEYFNKPVKEKKLYPMWAIWIKEIFTWIFSKGVTLAAICMSTLYLMIEGSKDWVLLFSGVGGGLMAFGFGFLALDKMYTNYIANEVPRMRKALEIRNKQDKGDIKDDCI